MKEKYKSYVDQIHAPEQLIENTIKRVKEEKKIQKDSKRRNFRPYIAAGAAAAIVMIAVNINSSINSVKYTSISEPMIRNHGKDNVNKNITREDYEKLIGINLEKLIDEEKVAKEDFNIIMGADETTPIYDEGILIFSDNDRLINIKLSKTNDILPEQLVNSQESEIGIHKVHFGSDYSEKRLYAGGNINGVNYFITGNGIEKKEFQKKVEKYLNNMKPFEE